MFTETPETFFLGGPIALVRLDHMSQTDEVLLRIPGCLVSIPDLVKALVRGS